VDAKNGKRGSTSNVARKETRRENNQGESQPRGSSPVASLENDNDQGIDPDAPGLLRNRIPQNEYLRKRAVQIARLRGVQPGKPFDIQKRISAVRQMEVQKLERFRKWDPLSPEAFDWVPIGPAPIPNGQTQTTIGPVSGRVTAIDIHPTNPLIAYVGTA